MPTALEAQATVDRILCVMGQFNQDPQQRRVTWDYDGLFDTATYCDYDMSDCRVWLGNVTLYWHKATLESLMDAIKTAIQKEAWDEEDYDIIPF